MKQGSRTEALNKTLQGIAHWATKIEKDGISLRFLNRVDDEKDSFNNLTDVDKIDDLLSRIPRAGGTKLGTVLRKKILNPLADKAAKSKKTGTMVKPRIIVIITDGEVGLHASKIRVLAERRPFFSSACFIRDQASADGYSPQENGASICEILLQKSKPGKGLVRSLGKLVQCSLLPKSATAMTLPCSLMRLLRTRRWVPWFTPTTNLSKI